MFDEGKVEGRVTFLKKIIHDLFLEHMVLDFS